MEFFYLKNKKPIYEQCLFSFFFYLKITTVIVGYIFYKINKWKPQLWAAFFKTNKT